jgi:uncharacterized protein (DUF1697 family)
MQQRTAGSASGRGARQVAGHVAWRGATLLATMLLVTAVGTGCSAKWDGARGNLRTIAILPVAYVDEAGGGYPCDFCEGVELKPTDAKAARLVTGFFYERMARHPHLLVPSPETVDAVAADGMRAAATSLAEAGRAEAVVAASLIELRPRLGDDQNPEKPAGAALYASLVDARSGEILWSKTFDRDEKSTSRTRRAWQRVAGNKPWRWSTAEGYSEVAVRSLVKDLVEFLQD